MSRKVELSDPVPQLAARLEEELRRAAWAIVGVIVRAECERRAAVLNTVGLALDAALTKTRAPSPPARARRELAATAPLGVGASPAAESPAAESPAAEPLSPVADAVPVPRPASNDSSRTIGTVKWFNDAKGFGFILGPDGEEVFVHYKHLAGRGHRSLVEGATVRYLAREGPRGRFAIEVSA